MAVSDKKVAFLLTRGVEQVELTSPRQALDEAGRVDYRSRLGDVQAKTLVLVGSNDKANLTAARDLAAGIPGARLEVMQGVGHQPNTEAPDAFNALVWPFLSEE